MPRITPVPASRLKAGDFVADCDERDLIYFLLNVGDGDAQLLLLPVEQMDGGASFRRALVIDVADAGKFSALVGGLAATPLFSPEPGVFAVVVGTHPHDDHIEGMPEFIDGHGGMVAEYWEPGYYHPTAAFLETMRALEEHPGIGHVQPTSGLTRFVGNVKIVALSPGIGLRNRFDSYGISINNASIGLKVEFPAARVEQRGADRQYLRIRNTQSLILGADAQTLSWAQIVVDFPELRPDESPVAKQLRMALGADPLRAQIFKVPHHASKHGVNLELVELINPDFSLVSSVGGEGRYRFPHTVALEMIREGLETTTSTGRAHRPDHDLGIHYTAAKDDTGKTLGTMALVVSPTGSKRHLWRFGDESDQDVDLAKARQFIGSGAG